jgi:hypothetical protein
MMISTDVIMSDIIHNNYKKKVKHSLKEHSCVECKSKNLSKSNCETFCMNCGLVLSGNSGYVGLRKITYDEGLKLN